MNLGNGYWLETLAVIVGILVAFALDNWNENRNVRKKEAILLKEIRSEYLLNRRVLEDEDLELVSSNNRIIDLSAN